MEPDDASRLSDGAVIEARLDARLLGLRVLRVDGTVLLAPGHVVEPPRAVPGSTGSSVSAPPPPDRTPGGGLALAAQLLADNRARLRERSVGA